MSAQTQQHTPGPWELDTIETEGGDYGFKAFAVYGPDGKVLFDSLNSDAAVIHEAGDEIGVSRWDETARVNLTLARAAPELLEALRDLVQTADSYWTPCKSTQWPALDAARAAIAKATP